MNNAEKLLALIINNPDLPIVPVVNADVVCDDCGCWMGCWGQVEVTEYYIGREYYHLKDDDEEDTMNDMVGCKYGYDKDGRDIYELSDEEWERLYNSLPWVKAIVVHITT